MNKKILLTTIIAIIAVGVTSAYAVIDLKTDNTVTGDLAVTGDITGPTNTALTTSIASAPVCAPQDVVHYDKIIYHPTLNIADCGVPSGNPTELLTKDQFGNGPDYDIKVLDDPTKVADVNQKVADFINNLNYCSPGGQAGDLTAMDIHVTDVDYRIVCKTP